MHRGSSSNSLSLPTTRSALAMTAQMRSANTSVSERRDIATVTALLSAVDAPSQDATLLVISVARVNNSLTHC